MPKKLSGKEIGETTFMVAYLLFLLVSGIISIVNKNYGLIILIMLLGIGDAFHLIPRIIKNIKGDFKKSDFYLGLGNQISSITMTIFYIVLILLLGVSLKPIDDLAIPTSMIDNIKHCLSAFFMTTTNPSLDFLISSIFYLGIIRIILCLLPQNNWYKKEGNFKWSVIRNIPFIIMGIIMTIYMIKYSYYYLGILILLSFLFYIPVALFAKKNPKLGMLMIPKTICYILMIIYFL